MQLYVDAALTWMRAHPETFANVYLWVVFVVLLAGLLGSKRKV